MEKKRIVLFLIDTLTTGGAEKSLLEIARGMEAFEPVFCTVFNRNMDLEQDFERAGIRLYSLELLSGSWWIKGPVRLRKLLKELNPAVIHATLFTSEVISRLTPRGRIPLINSFVNDSYSPVRYSGISSLARAKLMLYQLIDRLTAFRCDHFVSITNAIVETNRKALKVPTHKVTVIYRGRNIETPAPSTSEVEHIRQQFKGRPLMLTVARLLLRKGYRESIEAFASFASDHPEARYLIAGEGHDRTLIEERIRSLNMSGKIILLGTRRDIPALLAAADFFVFPSHYEGQGGALVEAMLAGKPIVATRIPVFEEQIQHGKSGRLFTPFDVNDLTEQIRWTSEHRLEADDLGREAQLTARERFDVRKAILAHENLYQSIIKK